MGCRILHDSEQDIACLYDSVTGAAFGCIFEGLHDGPTQLSALEEAQAFLGWCLCDDEHDPAGDGPDIDPRRVSLVGLDQMRTTWSSHGDDMRARAAQLIGEAQAQANDLTVALQATLIYVQAFAAVTYAEQEQKEATLRLARVALSEEAKG